MLWFIKFILAGMGLAIGFVSIVAIYVHIQFEQDDLDDDDYWEDDHKPESSLTKMMYDRPWPPQPIEPQKIDWDEVKKHYDRIKKDR